MKNKKIASVRPSPLASIAGIIGLIIMLIFGFAIVPDTGGGFLFIWMFFGIGGIIYFFLNLLSYSKTSSSKIPITADEVIEIESGEDSSADFETRLRKLEALKKDRLISEEEYKHKREEIMNERW